MKGKIIDLTHTIHSDIPGWDGSCGFKMDMVLDYKDCAEPYVFRKHEIQTPSGIGTHIDSPSHCAPGGKTVSDLDIDNLVTECIVIKNTESDNENYIFMPESILEFEEKNGKIKPNTFVIFYTTWNKYWESPEKYINNHKFPSVHESTAKLLLERDISGIGIDTLSADTGEYGFPVHKMILGAGKYLVENIANANMLPEKGCEVFILPMKIKDAAESPVRMVATI